MKNSLMAFIGFFVLYTLFAVLVLEHGGIEQVVWFFCISSYLSTVGLLLVLFKPLKKS